jgi:hypothetical protein
VALGGGGCEEREKSEVANEMEERDIRREKNREQNWLEICIRGKIPDKRCILVQEKL